VTKKIGKREGRGKTVENIKEREKRKEKGKRKRKTVKE
jgi:hypothetical protein